MACCTAPCQSNRVLKLRFKSSQGMPFAAAIKHKVDALGPVYTRKSCSGDPGPVWETVKSLKKCKTIFSLVLLYFFVFSAMLFYGVKHSQCSLYSELALLPESMCVYVEKSWPGTQSYPISSTE